MVDMLQLAASQPLFVELGDVPIDLGLDLEARRSDARRAANGSMSLSCFSQISLVKFQADCISGVDANAAGFWAAS